MLKAVLLRLKKNGEKNLSIVMKVRSLLRKSSKLKLSLLSTVPDVKFMLMTTKIRPSVDRGHKLNLKMGIMQTYWFLVV